MTAPSNLAIPADRKGLQSEWPARRALRLFGACQTLRRRGNLNDAGNGTGNRRSKGMGIGRDNRDANGTTGTRNAERGRRVAVSDNLQLPLLIPCAVARQDAAPPRLGDWRAA